MIPESIVLSKIQVSKIFYYTFACSCPDLPTPFVGEAIFTPFYALAPFVDYYLTIETWVYFWAPYSVPLIYVFLCQYQAVLITMAL